MRGDSEASSGAFEDVFNAVNEAILVHNAETLNVLDANRGAEELFGYSAAELDQVGVAELTADEPEYSTQAFDGHVQEALEDAGSPFEWRIERTGGAERQVEVTPGLDIVDPHGWTVEVSETWEYGTRFETVTDHRTTDDVLLSEIGAPE